MTNDEIGKEFGLRGEKGCALRRALREESEQKYEEGFELSEETDDKILEEFIKDVEKDISDLCVLDIPSELVPKDKIWRWVRYSCMGILDESHLQRMASLGWRPVWAINYPELHVESPFFIYRDVILCERDKPKESRIKKAFNWIKGLIGK